MTHTVEVRCRADAIPTGIEVDVGELEINHSKHLSDIKLPEGVRVRARPRHHAGHRGAAVGLCGRNEGRCRSRCCRRGRCCRRRCRACGGRRCAGPLLALLPALRRVLPLRLAVAPRRSEVCCTSAGRR